MKRRILTLILAIVMLSSVAIIATADETQGSIRFNTGSIIIKPPEPPVGDCFCCPDCCPGDYGSGDLCTCPSVPDPRCPCPCTCDDYDRFFREHRVSNDLYFGQHALTIFGRFDSANNQPGSPQENEERYTTRTGEFTGVEVINQTPRTAQISVEIDDFKIGGPTGAVTLDGFELRLMQKTAIMRDDSSNGGTPIGPGSAFGGGINFVLEADGNAHEILTVESAREVKAAWSGLLDIEPGTPRQPGIAQATLTWTGLETP